MATTLEFRPSSRYRQKVRCLAYIPMFIALLIAMLFAVSDASEGYLPYAAAAGIVLVALVVAGAVVVFLESWVSASWYELRPDEVVVHKGIIVQSLKVVPYRNITNIARKRDVLDRWFFRLGSLEVQTAGSSGTASAEEILVGLDDWEGIYTRVMTSLAAFRRQAMTPSAVINADDSPSGDLSEVLAELRAIRALLERAEARSTGT